MFDPSSIIVGLELGTSKVCAVVGELNAEGALNIVGLGQARSRGVRKGEIADPNVAEAHCNLGTIYLVQGRLSDAIAELNRAVELSPTLAIARERLAMARQKAEAAK